MSIVTSEFGKTKSGEETHLYTITNESCSLSVTDFGAVLVSIKVPDKNGNVEDVVLGCNDALGYETESSHLGGTIGRNANRIAGASLVINKKEYLLEANNSCNNLHSGLDYYDKRMWQVKPIDDNSNEVCFVLKSPHMDQGYPGNLEVSVTYTLTDDNSVEITYDAISDADTIVNMTNHSYFNLSGDGNGTIENHKMWIDADEYTPFDEESIPTGEIASVEGTRFDFRTEHVIGEDYDHNWVLKNQGKLQLVATYSDEESGRFMEVFTDLPGIQVYTGNGLSQTGRGGEYLKHSAICFETQYFPDSVHHENFPSPILKAGEKYHSVTKYRFTVK